MKEDANFHGECNFFTKERKSIEIFLIISFLFTSVGFGFVQKRKHGNFMTQNELEILKILLYISRSLMILCVGKQWH